jgi:DNA replication and repair protein RecF
MKDISEEKEEINIEYISDIEEFCEKREVIKKKYEEIFSSSEEREKAAGLTLFGPHRDDIKIEINGSLARSYSSQGQQRSVVLSMKLSEGEIIKEKIGEYPIYIFDDVLSELDEGRQRYVLSGREGMQLIITACKMSDIISEGVNIIKVEGGFYN